MLTVKLCQTNGDSPFENAERHAIVTQRNYAQYCVRSEAHKVARVNLNLQTRLAIGGNRITFDERKIELGTFPIGITSMLQVYVPRDQADANNACFDVIVISIIVGGLDNYCGSEKRQEEKENRGRDKSGRTH
jgi:hypothetical protein